MSTDVQQILHELKTIKEELHYIRSHMVGADTILTSEEKALLDQSYIHEKEGKLVSGKELRKQLGL